MGALQGKNFAQVGFIVKDIREASIKFAAVLGCDVPAANLCGTPEAETHYKGQPAPKAQSKLAFFDLVPGVQLELIEPNEEMSTWREYLNEKGEGIHHIAFNVENMDEVIKECEAEGMELVQYGFYDDKSGRYAYLDGGSDYKCVIELLESFHK